MSIGSRIKRWLIPSSSDSQSSDIKSPGQQFHWKSGIWCPIVGGLANQLICYRVGRMLADIHRVPLMLDFSHYQADGSRPFLLPHFAPRFDVSFTTDVLAAPWRAQANDLLVNITERGTAHFWNPESQQKLRSAYLSAPTKPVIADLWVGLAFQLQARDYFREPQNLADHAFDTSQLNSAEQALLRLIQSCEHAVAIHVRRTDFATHDGGLLAPSTQYNSAISHIEREVGPCSVFVFSDDHAWCSQNLRSQSTIHFSPVRGEHNGHKDLYLASQCRHKILTSESTFSQLIDSLSPFYADARIIARCSARTSEPAFAEYIHA